MTDREKMREFENWLNGQIEETNKRRIEAQEAMMYLKVMREVLIGNVLRAVWNKFRKIEKAD